MDLFITLFFLTFAWPAGVGTVIVTCGVVALATRFADRLSDSDPTDKRAFICWMVIVFVLALVATWKVGVIASFLFGSVAGFGIYVVWIIIQTTHELLPALFPDD